MVNGSSEVGEFLVFCGAPWLAWMTANRPQTKLGLKDFAAQDAQIDQLFYIETENRMVEDLEQLNSELRKAHTRLEASEAARSAFFAQMSHEMRTPLNGVLGAAELMSIKDLPDDQRVLVDVMRDGGRNLVALLDNLGKGASGACVQALDLMLGRRST